MHYPFQQIPYGIYQTTLELWNMPIYGSSYSWYIFGFKCGLFWRHLQMGLGLNILTQVGDFSGVQRKQFPSDDRPANFLQPIILW